MLKHVKLKYGEKRNKTGTIIESKWIIIWTNDDSILWCPWVTASVLMPFMCNHKTCSLVPDISGERPLPSSCEYRLTCKNIINLCIFSGLLSHALMKKIFHSHDHWGSKLLLFSKSTVCLVELSRISKVG